jgi:hypothetical protein
MASPKKEWTKPVVRKLPEDEVQGLARRHEAVREMLEKRPGVRSAA